MVTVLSNVMMTKLIKSEISKLVDKIFEVASRVIKEFSTMRMRVFSHVNFERCSDCGISSQSLFIKVLGNQFSNEILFKRNALDCYQLFYTIASYCWRLPVGSVHHTYDQLGRSYAVNIPSTKVGLQKKFCSEGICCLN